MAVFFKINLKMCKNAFIFFLDPVVVTQKNIISLFLCKHCCSHTAFSATQYRYF